MYGPALSYDNVNVISLHVYTSIKMYAQFCVKIIFVTSEYEKQKKKFPSCAIAELHTVHAKYIFARFFLSPVRICDLSV